MGIPIGKLFEALGRARFERDLIEEQLGATQTALALAQARIAELEGTGKDKTPPKAENPAVEPDASGGD